MVLSSKGDTLTFRVVSGWVSVPALTIDPRAAHDAHAGTPVFIDVEAIDLNMWSYRARDGQECGMESQRRRDQIDQRRFIANFEIAKEPGARDVAAPSMSFYSSPIISSL